MSRVTLGACLVLGWLFLWGDGGVGPVLGGAAVVVVLFVMFPSERAIRPHVVVHPLAVAGLVAYFVRQVIVSNLMLSRELLRRTPAICSRVVVVSMHTTSPSLLTMVTNLAALSPGTMVVDADLPGPDDPQGAPPTLSVHVLMFGGSDDPSRAIATIRQLEERSVRAFGTADAIAELESSLAAEVVP